MQSKKTNRNQKIKRYVNNLMKNSPYILKTVAILYVLKNMRIVNHVWSTVICI